MQNLNLLFRHEERIAYKLFLLQNGFVAGNEKFIEQGFKKTLKTDFLRRMDKIFRMAINNDVGLNLPQNFLIETCCLKKENMAEILADGIYGKAGEGIPENNPDQTAVFWVFAKNQSSDVDYLVVINDVVLRVAPAHGLRARLGAYFYP